MSDAPPLLSYDAELKRKAIHLAALAIPVGILVVGRPLAAPLLVTIATLALLCDVARHRVRPIHRAVTWGFAPLMRPEERPPFGGPIVLNGATWMFVSAALCAVLLPEPVAAASLALLMVGDAAAAVVGRPFGRTRYPGSSKSLEGSIAFVLVGGVAALPFALVGSPPVPPGALAAAALVAAAVEALPVPINDNVRVPLLAGVVMLLLS